MTTIIVPGRPPRPVVVEIEGGVDVTLSAVRDRPVIVEAEAAPEITVAGRGPKGPKGDTGDYAPDSFETVARNFQAASAVLVWSGEDLVSVTYSTGVTKTLAYSDGDLQSVTLSGSIPEGVLPVKTFTYAGENISGWSYSQGA